ncbi:hypothetical protein [Bifidobacterium adolescentis]|uniref:hypothetical protein n=1 Tax=Bifidobacterium adolescentis TaxID=1680 RepID=UPI0015F703DE|nr:hypothetical protein [Bifidobacterium adolescentis]GDY95822.1 hypothetical protein MCC01943_11090 [Bifidobacteriaceae bacterium MCC01943]
MDAAHMPLVQTSVLMTAEQWRDVSAYAEKHDISFTAAVRQLLTEAMTHDRA